MTSHFADCMIYTLPRCTTVEENIVKLLKIIKRDTITTWCCNFIRSYCTEVLFVQMRLSKHSSGLPYISDLIKTLPCG